MYKKLIYLLFILLTGVSCSEYLDQTGSGYLKISKISINADVEIQTSQVIFRLIFIRDLPSSKPIW